MKFGYFDNKNREYVITRPNTPLPWINYLGSEEYCALMSNTAGGYSFYVDPRDQRILRYRYDNVPFDRGGRYIYIRDNKSKDFYSPTWQPVMKELDSYECRHGMGYTVVSSLYDKIRTKISYLVPPKENLEIWMLEIKNESKKTRDLSIFSFVEFCLWNAVEDMTNFQRTWSIGEATCEGNIIYHLTEHREERNILAYFICSEKIDSFDTQRRDFLGNYGYNSLEKPDAVVKGKCSNSIAIGWAPVGSHCIKVKLKPRQEKTIIFVLGIAEKKSDAKMYRKKYKKKEAVLKELKNLAVYWDENLAKFKAETPDEDMNTMVNIWNQYQCRMTFNWSRYASYYEAGIGRGMGFRDSNQDTLGFVHQVPDKVKERIVDLASTQFERGDAYHQYSPLTKKGTGGGYSDDHLWLIFSVASYIKETGNIKFLEKMVPYDTGKSGKIYDHLERAIKFSWKHVGPHGLPLAYYADWNDCLNMKGKKGKAESVLVAEMFVAACNEMVRLAELSGRKTEARKYAKLAIEMSDRINKVAWGGAWYLRAFTDNRKPVGSSKNKEGKIYLETQPWAVISGVAPENKGIKTMNSVKKMLATEHGVILQQPAYQTYHPELGAVSAYPPGLKENAAIFCHPNPWAMIAECILGRGELAFEYYKAILPTAKNNIAEVRKTEPYVYCQMVAGRDHPDFGEGKNSWLTGTAAWNFVAASQYILGVRPDYKGLLIDPCIPKKWEKFTVSRHFRGARYNITVLNPNKVYKGVKEIIVDGRKISSNILPVFGDGKEHSVVVVMG